MAKKTRASQGRYKLFDFRWHADPRVQGLSPIPPCGQGLLFYLMFGPHGLAVPGLFRTGEASLAEALGWPLDAFRSAWAEVEGAGLAVADWKNRVVFVPLSADYEFTPGPEQLGSWGRILLEFPDCAVVRAAARLLYDRFATSPNLALAWAETFAGRDGFPGVTLTPHPHPPGWGVTHTHTHTPTHTPTPTHAKAEGEGGVSSGKKEEAGGVIGHYQRAVRPNYLPGPRAVSVVSGLLSAGKTPDELRAAATAYAKWLDAEGKEGRHRQCVHVFYSAEGKFALFAGPNPPPGSAPPPTHREAGWSPRIPDPPPEKLADSTDLSRRFRERQHAQANGRASAGPGEAPGPT